MEEIPTHYDFSYSEPSPTCVAAENCKVFLFEVPKVASSALKLLLSQANDTYSPDARFETIAPHTSIEQAIHSPDVSGLVPLYSLSPKKREAWLKSPQWWRVGGLRDPYSRLFSAWENRILLMPPARELERVARSGVTDLMDGNLINISATFNKFVHDFEANPNKFRLDGHLNTQTFTLRPEYVDYTHLFRVDVADQMSTFVQQLSERVGRPLELARLNENIGIKMTQVMTAGLARIVEEIYANDFKNFDFERRTFPEKLDEVVLTDTETRLVMQYRAISERLFSVSKVAASRAGGRYGLMQILHAPGNRVRYIHKRITDPRDL